MQDMDAVYQQHFRMVYQYLMSLTHQLDVAEELAQETFCQAVSSIHRYDGSCKITTWLCAIAKNQYLSYLRKHPMHEDLTDADASTIDFLKKSNQKNHRSILATVLIVSLLLGGIWGYRTYFYPAPVTSATLIDYTVTVTEFQTLLAKTGILSDPVFSSLSGMELVKTKGFIKN